MTRRDREAVTSAVMLALAAALQACNGNSEDASSAPPAEAGDVFEIRCGALLDGVGDRLLDDRVIGIRDARIVSVTPVGVAVADADDGRAPDLDLGGYTCLPGLIDTHVHLASRASDSSDMAAIYRRSIAETTRIAEANAATTIAAGFTTVRNVGDYFPAAVLDLRQRIEAGAIAGPRILTAGPYLTIPAGGGDLVIPGLDEAEIPAAARQGVARGPEEFADKAQAAIDAGADHLKVIASGAVFAFGGVPGAPEMTEAEIAAVVAVARANGVKVTAHAHGAESIKQAIRAGVDSIEHASLADDEAIAMAAGRGVAFSMDVYNGTYTAEVGEQLGYPEEFMRKNDETTEAQRIVFEKAHAAGVPILYGTDAAVYPHGLNARQFEVMVARGMSPADAIRSATSLAAEELGVAGDVGALVPGRYGDIVAVRGNPLEDISVLQDIAVVVKSGEVVRP